MDDSISRAAAIDALNGEITVTGETNAKAVMEYVNAVKGRLERIPPIQPKRGRWKGEGLGDYRCSLCGEVNTRTRTNYCPNCGAQMEKGGEDG